MNAYRLDGFQKPLPEVFEKLRVTYWSFYEGKGVYDIDCESKEEILAWLDKNRQSDYYDIVEFDSETGDVLYKERVDLETSFIPEDAVWKRDSDGNYESYSTDDGSDGGRDDY